MKADQRQHSLHSPRHTEAPLDYAKAHLGKEKYWRASILWSDEMKMELF